MVMITEIVIAIERKYRLLLRCHNAYFAERLAISGKLYTTQSYSRPFKKNNSIISINSSLNKVSIIKKTFSFHTKSDCIYSGCCLLDNPAHSKDLKIILFCDRLSLLQSPPPVTTVIPIKIWQRSWKQLTVTTFPRKLLFQVKFGTNVL